MALSLIVVFIYGGTIWYIFPTDPKISWEGHLSGFIVGILLALLFKKNTLLTRFINGKWGISVKNEHDFFKPIR